MNPVKKCLKNASASRLLSHSWRQALARLCSLIPPVTLESAPVLGIPCHSAACLLNTGFRLIWFHLAQFNYYVIPCLICSEKLTFVVYKYMVTHCHHPAEAQDAKGAEDSTKLTGSSAPGTAKLFVSELKRHAPCQCLQSYG